jgi:hypothetical protein
MTKRLGGALLAAILIAGAFFAWRHPVTQLTLPSETLHVVPGQPAESEAATPNVLPQNAGAPSLWVPPRPEVAAKHYRRSGMAWVLRQLGASERFLDQMTGSDLVVALNQLKAQAKAARAGGCGLVCCRGACGCCVRQGIEPCLSTGH